MARQDHVVEETEEINMRAFCEECWTTAETGNADLVVVDDFTIRAAQDRLRHLFENLFRNAVEHGGQAVTVRVGGLPDSDGFYVEDTGDGIPEADRESVFERGQTSGNKGLGIGLAIVDSVVAAHDWDITVSECAEGGARFEIRDVMIVDTQESWFE